MRLKNFPARSLAASYSFWRNWIGVVRHVVSLSVGPATGRRRRARRTFAWRTSTSESASNIELDAINAEAAMMGTKTVSFVGSSAHGEPHLGGFRLARLTNDITPRPRLDLVPKSACEFLLRLADFLIRLCETCGEIPDLVERDEESRERREGAVEGRAFDDWQGGKVRALLLCWRGRS